MYNDHDNKPLDFGFSEEDNWISGTGFLGETPADRNPSPQETPFHTPPADTNTSTPVSNTPPPILTPDQPFPEFQLPSVPSSDTAAPKADTPSLFGRYYDLESPPADRSAISNFTPEEIAFAKSHYNAGTPYFGRFSFSRFKDTLVQMFANPPVRVTLWLALSILLTIVACAFEEWWTVVLFVYQFAPGLLLYYHWTVTKRSGLFDIFLCLISAVTLTLAIMRFTVPELLAAISDQWIFLSLMGVINDVYLSFTVIQHISSHAKKKACSEYVVGTCFDLLYRKVRYRGIYRTLYCPLYEYTYKNKQYRVKSSHYFQYGVPRIGGQCVLRINPLDPTTFYDTASVRSRLSVGFIVCFIAIVMNLFFCFHLIAGNMDFAF